MIMEKKFVIVNTGKKGTDMEHEGVEILSEASEIDKGFLQWALCCSRIDDDWQFEALFFANEETAQAALKDVVKIVERKYPHFLKNFDYWVCEVKPRTVWDLNYNFNI